jgi:predicted acylesterase/phospholipase RssA
VGPDFQHPTQACDLVMKGGITSGIVYPPAVLTMARTYRFRSIGGTSAGAIAAAMTAAAEYGRGSGGFEKLQALSDQLSQGTFLQDLFQPSKTTAPLMNTLVAFLKTAKDGKAMPAARLLSALTFVLLREATVSCIIGATIGVGVSWAFAWVTSGSLYGKGVLLSLVLAWIGGMIGGGLRLARVLITHVPENFYGLCTGRTDDTTSDGPAVLTDWLSASIHDLAGKQPSERPLTFGELHDRDITVKMMTANLSQNLPYELPFGTRKFIFKQADFERLFPKNIVQHLVQQSYQSKSVRLPDGYWFLPALTDFPVAVAMRMSLSFPLLISAVPLFTMSRRAFKDHSGKSPLDITEADLQRNWFSDGGIASNFPIHFFDAWLPTRPTFGITLVSLPADAFTHEDGIKRERPNNMSILPAEGAEDGDLALEGAELRREDVFLPNANHRPDPDWKPLPHLLSFIWSIFATAQNYRDNTQAMLPSYRERVVQLRLSDDEGGLNLAMDPATIQRVREKGARAGEALLTDFNFNHHQWVRFRVLMGQLEPNLQAIETVLKDEVFPIARLIEMQLNGGDAATPFPYRRSQVWCDDALKRVTALRELVESWPHTPFFGQDTPLPNPVLRVTPEV